MHINAPASDPLSTARAFHQAWTSRDYRTARRQLDGLCWIEEPFHKYDSPYEFMTTVILFGDTTYCVELLAEFADDTEAMLLYDITMVDVGILRIADFFTVSAGRIIRLVRVHDTAILRNAELPPNSGHFHDAPH
ncbi:MAG: hypothetical protein HOQ24_11460 [Mycobacteriaceae bacterium]|nr:hypothetical protein [Mycobacteriaceae bacterium]